jgi:hypothetical protein
MKFIKKLFKKQKKEIGGSGIAETTVYLDNDFKSYAFEVYSRGSGGGGGSFSNSLCEINLSNLPKQIKVGNYDYNLRIDFFDDKIIAGFWNRFGPNKDLTITQEKNETLNELLSRLLALVKVNINSNN